MEDKMPWADDARFLQWDTDISESGSESESEETFIDACCITYQDACEEPLSCSMEAEYDCIMNRRMWEKKLDHLAVRVETWHTEFVMCLGRRVEAKRKRVNAYIGPPHHAADMEPGFAKKENPTYLRRVVAFRKFSLDVRKHYEFKSNRNGVTRRRTP